MEFNWFERNGRGQLGATLLNEYRPCKADSRRVGKVAVGGEDSTSTRNEGPSPHLGVPDTPSFPLEIRTASHRTRIPPEEMEIPKW